MRLRTGAHTSYFAKHFKCCGSNPEISLLVDARRAVTMYASQLVFEGWEIASRKVLRARVAHTLPKKIRVDPRF
ncbi:hypothetical protein LENED_006977 [Lentinula edodes]|uniref:Uncharacterized protein n=1 Tax=Lentinula edodes TaxID=5353 RepID=A0A1Q3ED52_LENED|nr:hypothetical protein LENED_006977 [Lentinula edodes]